MTTIMTCWVAYIVLKEIGEPVREDDEPHWLEYKLHKLAEENPEKYKRFAQVHVTE